jgi:hypothetical protein
VETNEKGETALREPGVLGNLTPAPKPGELPALALLPEPITWLNQNALNAFLEEVKKERQSEVDRIASHVELSLTELISKADEEIGKASNLVEQKVQLAEARLAQAETRHSELLARRERRRAELAKQRSLSLQAVERLASVIILPHPESQAPEIRNLRPNPETERIAMQVAIEHEKAQGRQVYDVHEKDLGYDITSLDLNSGELRLIEAKGIGASSGTILLTPNEKRVAEDRRDCYWLYVVTDCNSKTPLLSQFKDPAHFNWQEVTKVSHYCLTVNALNKPQQK